MICSKKFVIYMKSVINTSFLFKSKDIFSRQLIAVQIRCYKKLNAYMANAHLTTKI